MPGGQPQVLSTRFRGLNRLLASYMLDAAESPDTADAGQYGNVSQVLGPRGGRKPIQALPFPIKGVVPLNLSWLKLQLIATADGNITPYTINDPVYFNDFGGMLAYSLSSGQFVSANGGWYFPGGNVPPSQQALWTIDSTQTNLSVNLQSQAVGNTPGIYLSPRWSKTVSEGSSTAATSVLITNTGSKRAQVTLYYETLNPSGYWPGTPVILSANGGSFSTSVSMDGNFSINSGVGNPALGFIVASVTQVDLFSDTTTVTFAFTFTP